MKKEAKYKEYHILIEDNNSVNILSSEEPLTPVKPKLREIANEIDFDFEENWNTQTLGAKLVDHLHKMSECQKNEGKAIVINRMYVGDYLSSNLGHEVINMYTADNGKHYLYLNAYGSFAEKWQGKIGYMLLTKYHSKDCVEVIGKAIGLHDVYNHDEDGSNTNKAKEISPRQFNFIEHDKVSYGNVPLNELFSNTERQSVYITFKAEKVFKINEGKNIYLHYQSQESNLNKGNNVLNNNEIHVYLQNNNLALASLDQFFEEKNKDYQILYDLINLKNYEDYWVELGEKEKISLLDDYEPRKNSFFDICQIQNNENCFSNALAYFMKQDKYVDLWCNFFENYLNSDIKLSGDYWIKREEKAKITDNEYKKNNNVEGGGRIDLIIRDSNNVIVIENKIKSDINKKESDRKADYEKNQLHRYKEYVDWRISSEGEDKGKTVYYSILTPKYNQPEITDLICEKGKQGYKIITYKDLYEFLGSQEEIWQDDSNMCAFYEAMYRHTHENVNDYLYYEMQEKLMHRIYEYHRKNSQS